MGGGGGLGCVCWVFNVCVCVYMCVHARVCVRSIFINDITKLRCDTRVSIQ